MIGIGRGELGWHLSVVDHGEGNGGSSTHRIRLFNGRFKMLEQVKQGPVQGSQGSMMDHNGMGSAFEGEGGGGMKMAAPKQLFGGDAPVQMRVKRFREQPEGLVDQGHIDAAKRVADRIDTGVKQARQQALNWPAFTGMGGYLGLWSTTAQAYNADPDNADMEFVHARFGYAIETLACEELGVMAEGLKISLQVASGMTRPDIVLRLPDGKTDVAWLDITAERSKGHIKNKASSGWSTKPYVAEILYPSLDPTEILSGTQDPIVRRMGMLKQQEQGIREEGREEYREYLQWEIGKFKEGDPLYNGTGGNQKKKETEVKEFFKDELGMDLGKNCNINLKGGLNYLGYNSGHFGMTGKKSSQHQMVDFIREQSQPFIDEELGGLYQEEMQSQSNSMMNHGFQPDVQSFMGKVNAPSRESVMEGIAVNASLEALSNLRAAQYRIVPYTKQDFGAAQMSQKMLLHVIQRPVSGDINALQAWTNEAIELIKWASAFLGEQERYGYQDPKLGFMDKDDKHDERYDQEMGEGWDDFMEQQ